jgi:hypothetical protein
VAGCQTSAKVLSQPSARQGEEKTNGAFFVYVCTLVLVFPALLFFFRSVLPVPLFRLFPVALFWLFLQRLIEFDSYCSLECTPVCTPCFE